MKRFIRLISAIETLHKSDPRCVAVVVNNNFPFVVNRCRNIASVY